MCLALMVDMVAREVRRVARGRAVRVIAVIILEMGSVKVYVKYFRGCAGVWVFFQKILGLGRPKYMYFEAMLHTMIMTTPNHPLTR